ncbi:MAG: hypothetical protein LBN34_03005 [Clostridiales Family XIII bacterium]|nr:hypothetical protein [Clostridiales Family XIII bacterium]
MTIGTMICKECGKVFVGEVETYDYVCFSCRKKKQDSQAKAPPAKGKKRRYVYNAKGKIAAEKVSNIPTKKKKRNDKKSKLLNSENRSNFNENGQGGNHFPQTKTRDVVGEDYELENKIHTKAAEGNQIAQQLEKLLPTLKLEADKTQED